MQVTSLWANRRGFMLSALCALALCCAALAPSSAAAASGDCGGPYPAQRDPSNPLMLPNPLRREPAGRRQLLRRRSGARGRGWRDRQACSGIDPKSLSRIDYSWAEFKQRIDSGDLSRRLQAQSQPRLPGSAAREDRRSARGAAFSMYSGGGGPGAIFGQVQQDPLPQPDGRSRDDPDHHHVLPATRPATASHAGRSIANRPTFERQVERDGRAASAAIPR